MLLLLDIPFVMRLISILITIILEIPFYSNGCPSILQCKDINVPDILDNNVRQYLEIISNVAFIRTYLGDEL